MELISHISWRREVVCGALAASFSHYLMHFHLAAAVQLPFAGLSDILEFSTPRPFCYRLFTPACLRLLTLAGVSPDTAVAAFEWGAFAALYYLFRVYLREFMEGARAAYAALAVYFVIPFVFIIPQPFTVWFPWDILSVCFFTAGLLLLYREQWVLWYPVFLVGTLNRETMGFLLPVLALEAWRRGHKHRLGFHLLVSAVLWIFAKGALAWAFRHRTGPWLAEWTHRAQEGSHWRENLGQLSTPSLWPYLLSALGFLWLLAWHLRGGVRDPYLRSSLAVVPLYFLCVFLFANIAEHRIYADLIPIVLAPVVVSACSGSEVPAAGRSGAEAPRN